MIKVYVYTLETMADWETGYVIAELNSGRFFKKDAPAVSLKTVGYSTTPIKTMGGLTITPDCIISDIEISRNTILILPGANTWGDPQNADVINKAKELLEIGGTVCAICGATLALANAGMLDNRHHTSNGAGFLEMFSPSYKGSEFFIDQPSVTDGNLITAGSTGGLEWAKQIIEYADVFTDATLSSWYDYFNTGKAEHFFALMQSLPSEK